MTNQNWSQSLKIEHDVARIITDQAHHGVNFDKQRAKWCIFDLTEKILNIDLKAIPQMPLMMCTGNTFNKPFLKNGQLTSHVIAYCEEHGTPEFRSQISGPFSRVWFEQFDMGKTGLVKEYLVSHGWIPDEWNWKDRDLSKLDEYMSGLLSSPYLNSALIALDFKGQRRVDRLRDHLTNERKWPTSPKITESSFETISGTIPQLVKDRVVWSHRRSLIQGLLDNLRPDGRLSAEANPCATPTGRMRHKTVVNIPAAGKSQYGHQCRSLFIGDWDNDLCKHWPMVGYDGSGLELRMLSHYINDDGFTNSIINGNSKDGTDIHSCNQRAAGLPTRDHAKTFIYAFIYGAGDAKLGSIIGGTSEDGSTLRTNFLTNYPLLGNLITRIQAEAVKGYLIGLDGRKLILRRDAKGKVMVHKALNTLLQGAGAIVMKYAMVLLDDWVTEAGLRAHKVLDVHDEGQWTCHPEDVPKLREFMESCVTAAGELLQMNVPLRSDSKYGRNWSYTH